MTALVTAIFSTIAGGIGKGIEFALSIFTNKNTEAEKAAALAKKDEIAGTKIAEHINKEDVDATSNDIAP